MNAKRVIVGVTMTARGLFRSRFVLLLLFVVPTLFFVIITLTTNAEFRVSFQLASVSEETMVEVSQRDEALIFIGLTAVGLMTAFLAMTLIHKHADEHRRLVLSGYRAIEVIASKLIVLLLVVGVIGTYVAGLLLLYFDPPRFSVVTGGFVLCGYVYGCYGLLVGALVKRELEAIFLIVLLANLDAGWLQNPIYYADAQNQTIIKSLPAYFPSQVSMTSAFTEYSVLPAFVSGMLYGTALLIAAMIIYSAKMQVHRLNAG